MENQGSTEMQVLHLVDAPKQGLDSGTPTDQGMAE
jgi:hypothetical protein